MISSARSYPFSMSAAFLSRWRKRFSRISVLFSGSRVSFFLSVHRCGKLVITVSAQINQYHVLDSGASKSTPAKYP